MENKLTHLDQHFVSTVLTVRPWEKLDGELSVAQTTAGTATDAAITTLTAGYGTSTEPPFSTLQSINWPLCQSSAGLFSPLGRAYLRFGLFQLSETSHFLYLLGDITAESLNGPSQQLPYLMMNTFQQQLRWEIEHEHNLVSDRKDLIHIISQCLPLHTAGHVTETSFSCLFKTALPCVCIIISQNGNYSLWQIPYQEQVSEL